MIASEYLFNVVIHQARCRLEATTTTAVLPFEAGINIQDDEGRTLVHIITTSHGNFPVEVAVLSVGAGLRFGDTRARCWTW